jgi:hypothetical protein
VNILKHHANIIIKIDQGVYSTPTSKVKMASIACRCGKVELKFPWSSPRISTECCCNHCYQRVKYLEELGGPTIPDKPLLASKWDNKITIGRGQEELFAYKLSTETLVTNIASNCCKTFLLGRHSGYDSNCVTTSSDFPIFHNVKEKMIPSSRWFTDQWDKKRLARYPKLIGIWVDDYGSIVGEEGWEDVFKMHQMKLEQEIPHDAKGLSFDEILDTAIGKDNIRIVSK